MDAIISKLKLVPVFILLAIVFILFLNPFVIIPSGYVGIKKTFGKIDENELKEGLNLVIPIIQSVDKVEVRTRALEFVSQRENQINALSKDGLPINIDIAILYKVKPDKAAELVKQYGYDFDDRVIKQIIRTSVRDSISLMDSASVYQERQKLQDSIVREVKGQLADRFITLEDILIRDIRLPASVVEAVEQKRRAYEEAQKMQFLLEREKLEAERKKVEAEGIAKANQIIANSLTKEYLSWKFIENIQEYAKSQNNTIILIPYDSKLTPILNVPQNQGQR
ncbi:MAG: prohibitin family protein [Hydrogenothermaceae bacterium]|nr:prohibitin family protein [Hydrogenothermaceae bacterium]